MFQNPEGISPRRLFNQRLKSLPPDLRDYVRNADIYEIIMGINSVFGEISDNHAFERQIKDRKVFFEDEIIQNGKRYAKMYIYAPKDVNQDDLSDYSNFFDLSEDPDLKKKIDEGISNGNIIYNHTKFGGDTVIELLKVLDVDSDKGEITEKPSISKE